MSFVQQLQSSQASMPCPWDLVSEALSYARLVSFMSASCKLAPHEEQLLTMAVYIPNR